MSKEYEIALNAYNKLYRIDKLKFILNNLDILHKQENDLDLIKPEILELYKQITQTTLYKEMRKNG